MTRALPAPALSAGAACLSLLAIAPADRLVFEPEPRSESERTYTWTSSMESEDASVLLDGEPTPAVPIVRANVERTFQVVASDRFIRSAKNRPLELVRTFEDISGELFGDVSLETADATFEMEVEGDRASPLGGVGVRFVWDGEEGAFEVRYADDLAADQDLIEDLTPDGHFIALLPEVGEALEIGAEWEIDPARFAAVLRPFGDLRLETETTLSAMEGVLDPLMLPGPFEVLSGAATGEVTATLADEQEGVATIEIAVELAVPSDQSARVRPLVADALPDGVRARLERAAYGAALDGTATLRWDLAANRVLDFTFDADAAIDIALEFALVVEDQTSAFSMEEVRAGELAFRVE